MAGQFTEVLLEVAHFGVDVESRELPTDRRAGLLQDDRVDVEGDEPLQGSRLRECSQEASGLLRGAAAEFQQGGGGAQLGDLVGVGVQDGRLGAARVVLRESGDLVEEVAAAAVVEVLGGGTFGVEVSPARTSTAIWRARAPGSRCTARSEVGMCEDSILVHG